MYMDIFLEPHIVGKVEEDRMESGILRWRESREIGEDLCNIMQYFALEKDVGPTLTQEGEETLS